MRINSKARVEELFIHNYLDSFTAKILVPLTAFTKLIVIFYPRDGKL